MTTLTHLMNHHARALRPIIGTLTTEVIDQLVPAGWQLRRVRTSHGSWSIHRDGREFHFRPLVEDDAYTGIQVRDAYRLGKVVAVLRSRDDVLRWVEGVAA